MSRVSTAFTPCSPVLWQMFTLYSSLVMKQLLCTVEWGRTVETVEVHSAALSVKPQYEVRRSFGCCSVTELFTPLKIPGCQWAVVA